MNAIPASVAGVSRRIVVSPISDLKKSSIVLAAAYVAEVTDFICMGGAHSIGALAYGTETILPVNKIVGPGNAYVAEAKRQVFGKVGIDSIAGPSEVLIVADKTANPDYVAIDLLSQAEHDEQAQAILLTNDLELAQNVQNCIEKFLKELPRSKIASSSWNDFGSIILFENMDAAIDLVNEIAPEHLQLMTSNTESLLKKIKNAGAIFIGHYTPEAVGDYIAGPNHVLPTNGTAKFSIGLGVLDFCKRTTVVEFNKNNLDAIGKNVVTLAKAEGLEAHAMSVALRLNNK
jgi:histidinol dehydrogenase